MATNKSSVPAHHSTDAEPPKPGKTLEAHYAALERLGDLEDDLRHADLGVEERCELEDRVKRLRRRVRRS